ncbi:ATP-dependent DNA helicase RecG [Jatrophihabitans sp. GAS493]|uniref:ATP-dependent DNA helicase RecG n=1 Tax=Jatrophihabitans sp. GAS493 TaxID=1907575 RepID=UPI000BB89DE6|nr:ATP-dependent DNA helicase RecG [Jatrophihabitans sp. GAS493]SOD73428.1 ATP-dependent DNA helicase RecG [Jatrophihabitans sp. GAS493]
MAKMTTPLVEVVGDRTAKLFSSSLQIETVADLLRHYPRRLAERGELTDLASLRLDEDVTVLAEVRSIQNFSNFSRKSSGNRRLERAEVIVGDGRGTLALTFFNAGWKVRDLTVGTRALFAGKVGEFRNKRQLVNPEFQLLVGGGFDDFQADDFANTVLPIYPATAKLRSWTIAKTVDTVLAALDRVPDPLSDELLLGHRLLSLDAALRQMHRPKDWAEWAAAKKRLKWDEALGVQLALAQRRMISRANPATPRPPRADGLLTTFDQRLPFELTAGQREVGRLLTEELASTQGMQRLLQGEVGSGKTIVALRAMLQVVDAGGQAALLAPTEVLATQHARSIELMLGELAQAGRLGGSENATRVALLTGSLPTKARRAALLDVAGGAAGIVVGTHALIQEHVSFAELGFVVVDEQHRFGVEQRDALRGKAERPPHLLVMTATPIPRTVAMTVFGDLETSVLSELPKGRSPISTSVVGVREHPAWLARVWQRIIEEVGSGHQAFIVCPRIGDGQPESDSDPDDAPPEEAQASTRRSPLAATEVITMLADGALAGLRLGLLHGRLAPDEKDRVMSAFSAGDLDVLVSTTVVEVGVDVPNATVMVVLDAERFGVSQLHQLRGRIGRGSAAGVCLLVTETPEGSPSRERLDAVAATSDGFELAQLDLEQRREGDVLGASQSGRRSQLKLLSLLRDAEIIAEARDVANDLVVGDHLLRKHPELAAWLASLVDQSQVDFLEKA